jgi:hypothetical protein
VIAGAADKACEVHRRRLPDARDRLPVLRHGRHHQHHHAALPGGHPLHAALPLGAVPGHYNTEIQITRGFWMVSWFKEQFGLHEQQLAQQRGVRPRACSTSW